MILDNVRRADRWWQLALRWVNLLQPVLLLVCRLYIGYESTISGWGHLHHVDQTADYFKSLNIPNPRLNVYISGTMEYVGGWLLMLGLFSRLIAIPLTFNFLIAIVSVHLQDSVVHNSIYGIISALWRDVPFQGSDYQSVIIQDTAFPFFFVSLLVLVFGPGIFSIDGLLRRQVIGRDKS